ncbi:uncharacterized protein DUF2180 [Pseudonocardia hierapolitana]|uniref:Uncharacterized protein DUF2180 n=1 Tax=Pseudonocardia hierapolitana TaxID=1128676 RepID=A0A561SJE4_9PSEU|nr:DUF2180 family protein [Pseudonocardia hierapolitana]TWF74959.1 uncharacterized protein DUF2180 [Pseudonocardia hierapolitana]
MRCLDCMTAGIDPSFGPEPVVALCAYCSAAVCYHHARTTSVAPPLIGLVAQTTRGVRRILCTQCAGTATTASASAPRPRAGAATP